MASLEDVTAVMAKCATNYDQKLEDLKKTLISRIDTLEHMLTALSAGTIVSGIAKAPAGAPVKIDEQSVAKVAAAEPKRKTMTINVYFTSMLKTHRYNEDGTPSKYFSIITDCGELGELLKDVKISNTDHVKWTDEEVETVGKAFWKKYLAGNDSSKPDAYKDYVKWLKDDKAKSCDKLPSSEPQLQ